MRRVAAVAGSMVAALLIAALYHVLYEAVVAEIDDPWRSSAGSAGPRILAAKTIRIELDHPTGFTPHPDAITRLDARIENLTGQSVEIEVSVADVPDSGKVTLADGAAAERANRQTPHISSDSVGIYVLYVGGEFALGDSVLGVAYLGYSVMVFRQVVESAGTPRPGGECAGVLGPTPCEIERAVLVHEIGHLLGLVNINYESKLDHWDESHGHHCAVDSCVMFWQVESSGPLSGPPPDDFDPKCRADIAQIRAMWAGPPPRHLADGRYSSAIALIIASCVGIGLVVAWLAGPAKRPRSGEVALPPPLPPAPPQT